MKADYHRRKSFRAFSPVLKLPTGNKAKVSVYNMCILFLRERAEDGEQEEKNGNKANNKGAT